MLLLCLKNSKQDGLVWDRKPLREEEQHNLSSAFMKQCQGLVRILQRKLDLEENPFFSESAQICAFNHCVHSFYEWQIEDLL